MSSRVATVVVTVLVSLLPAASRAQVGASPGPAASPGSPGPAASPGSPGPAASPGSPGPAASPGSPAAPAASPGSPGPAASPGSPAAPAAAPPVLHVSPGQVPAGARPAQLPAGAPPVARVGRAPAAASLASPDAFGQTRGGAAATGALAGTTRPVPVLVGPSPAPIVGPIGTPASATAATSGARTSPLSLAGQPIPDNVTPGGLPSAATNVARLNEGDPRVPPPSLNEAPERSLVTPAELVPSPSADAVASAQVILAARGLYRGPVTGLLTGPTRSALALFQSAVRLPITGTLDPRTAERMGIRADGRLSAAEQAALVESIQLDAGLPVTGELDEATRALLAEGLIPTEDGVPVTRFRSDVGPVVQP